MDLYRKSAAGGNVTATYNIGYMYERGEGVRQDFQEAVKWFQLAADKGYKDGAAEIGNVQKMAAQAGQTITLPPTGQAVPPAPGTRAPAPPAPPAQAATAPAPAPAPSSAAAGNAPAPQDDPHRRGRHHLASVLVSRVALRRAVAREQ